MAKQTKFSVRLKSYFDHWKESDSVDNDFEKLVDLILREQFMFSSGQDIQIWLREHQPKTVSELVSLAEAYQLDHKESDQKKFQRKFFQYRYNKAETEEKVPEACKSSELSQKQGSDSTGHLIATCPLKVKKKTPNESGHKPRQANSLLYSPTMHEYRGKNVEIPVVAQHVQNETELINGLKIMEGFVDNKPVTVVRDTGWTAISVSETLVDSDAVSPTEKEVTLADGSNRKCKEVQVN